MATSPSAFASFEFPNKRTPWIYLNAMSYLNDLRQQIRIEKQKTRIWLCILPPCNTYIFQLRRVNSFWAMFFNVTEEAPCLINNSCFPFWRRPGQNKHNTGFLMESHNKGSSFVAHFSNQYFESIVRNTYFKHFISTTKVQTITFQTYLSNGYRDFKRD